jgi:hypothetical protein
MFFLIKKEFYYMEVNMEVNGRERKVVRICAMSDTHNQHDFIDIKSLPKADIFIHTGDFSDLST